MNCPDCGKRMEKGFLWADATSASIGPKWFKNMSMLPLGGDILAREDSMGNAWLQGWRCRKCQCLVVHY